MQRVLAALLVLAGVAIAGWVVLDTTGDDVGSVSIGAGDDVAVTEQPSPGESAEAAAAPTTGDATPAPEPEADAAPSPASTTSAELPEITMSSGSIDDVDLTRPPSPVRIGVPSLGIEAQVVTVGVEPDGEVVVPDDVSTIGWYAGSRAPGEGIGNTILIGHVDSRTQGRGAFFDLRIAEVGAVVSLADAEGGESVWQVTGRRTFEKTGVPMDDINQFYGEQRLLLITCGGEFDEATGSYESIVVVEAVPAT